MKGTPPERVPKARDEDPLRSAVWSAAVASASLVAQHVAGKATRDTLFLSHFGLDLLPAAMIGAALVSSVAVVGISRALGKYGPARIVPVMFGSSAVLFLLEWWLSLHSERAAAVAVYVHTAIYGSAAVSAFWSLVNERFDPHSAKKIVGRIASGGTIGGVVGGVVVWRASAHLSVPMMLALLAGINVFGLWGTLRTIGSARDGKVGTSAFGGKSQEPLAGGGWKIVRETPYLRDLALLVLAGAIINALLDWLLSAYATREYGKGPALLGFFALFNMIVGIFSFLAQTGLSRRLLEWRGLAGTVKTQPMTVALCAVLALLTPQFWFIVLLRGGEAVTRNSLYRSAYELFYTPLPTAKKRATKTIIDVGVDRVGTTIGSVALLAIVHLRPDLATRAVLIAAIAMAAVSWLVSARLHDGYVSALASSLKSGAVALGDDDLEDLTTRRTLAETTALLDRQQLLARIEQFQRNKEGKAKDAKDARNVKDAKVLTSRGGVAPSRPSLADPAPDTTALALEVAADPVAARAAALRSGDVARIKAALIAPLTPVLAGFVIPLLANDAVVRDAVRALRKIASRATGQLLDALLDPEVDPRVRRRIPRVLKMCRTQRAANGLLLALRDPLFEVRVQVGLGIKQMQDESHVTLQRDDVFEVVVHELTSGRASWKREAASGSSRDASVLSPAPADEEIVRGLAHVFTVLGFALEREPLSIAYRAIRSADPGLRGTAFEYLEVVLPPRVRDVLTPLLGHVKPASRARERGSNELADELLRSSASLARPVR
jgi:AAA family ATP:ADP antiporter